jgi:hypothetical protein
LPEIDLCPLYGTFVPMSVRSYGRTPWDTYDLGANVPQTRLLVASWAAPNEFSRKHNHNIVRIEIVISLNHLFAALQ